MSSQPTPASPSSSPHDPSPGTQKVLLGVGWVLVGVPLLYGLVQTLRRVVTLFTG